RLMSRTQAKKELSMDSYKNEMNGIYSTSVCEETIDEAPMAYKPTEEIVELIKPTVNVIDVIKPIYNFKAKL
ncbi:MAG TPA: RNA-splicing ligase RtcB, partial [Prevotella sp.]|nr:RNA-splicing ligase RtcB [Prevotella sp.]